MCVSMCYTYPSSRLVVVQIDDAADAHVALLRIDELAREQHAVVDVLNKVRYNVNKPISKIRRVIGHYLRAAAPLPLALLTPDGVVARALGQFTA